MVTSVIHDEQLKFKEKEAVQCDRNMAESDADPGAFTASSGIVAPYKTPRSSSREFLSCFQENIKFSN